MPDLNNMNMGDMPNPDELHQHISGLLDGKLGRLASEITENSRISKIFQEQIQLAMFLIYY